jgi:hypothetical protein
VLKSISWCRSRPEALATTCGFDVTHKYGAGGYLVAMLSVRSTDESTIRLLDGAVGAWVVLWIVIGGWSAYTTWQLSELGDTVSRSGSAISAAGSALESLREVPVVGERPAELCQQTAATGGEIQTRGQEVKGQLRQLAILLGLSIAIIPTTPFVGLYVPLRGARRRDLGEIARALLSSDDHDGFDRYLAERAIRHLTWHEAHQLVHDPWHALDEGHHRALADAELARLGLHRTSGLA